MNFRVYAFPVMPTAKELQEFSKGRWRLLKVSKTRSGAFTTIWTEERRAQEFAIDTVEIRGDMLSCGRLLQDWTMVGIIEIEKRIDPHVMKARVYYTR